MNKLRIGVIADWARSSRGDGWDAMLEDFDRRGELHNERRTLRLADKILEPVQPAGQAKFFTQDLDVLIVNWDAANGDPEFGSHLALQWLQHRRPEILLWVRTGKVLIIEGQAVMSVPSQSTYDALVGRGELPVSGVVDRENPGRQIERMPGACRLTAHAPRGHGFGDIPIKLEVSGIRGLPTHQTLFPQAAESLVTAHLRETNWERTLCRGWFRRPLPGRRRLPWVSLVETSDRGRFKEQSTLKVACIEKGAIFATTMFLATAGQDRLVLAMLNCANGNTAHLPRPTPLVEWLRTHWKLALTLAAGLFGGLAAGLLEPWVAAARAAMASLGFETERWSPTLADTLVKLSFVPLGMLLFAVLHGTVKRLVAAIRDFLGY